MNFSEVLACHRVGDFRLLAELARMEPLPTVMQRANANSAEMRFVVVVPPDSCVPLWASGDDGRVDQAFVRAHLFRITCEEPGDEVACVLRLRGLSDSGATAALEMAPTEDAAGRLRLQQLHEAPTSDGQPEQILDVQEVCALANGEGQPPYLRVIVLVSGHACPEYRTETASPPLTRATSFHVARILSGLREAEPSPTECTTLAQHRRRFIDLSAQVVSGVRPVGWRCREAATECRALLSIANAAVSNAVFNVLDTEALVFESTYLCVSGFEAFTIEKVNGLIVQLITMFVTLHSTMIAAALDGAATNDGSPTRPAALQDSDASVAELEQDYVVVALHAVVLAALAPVLAPHWRKLHAAEDADLYTACAVLAATHGLDDSGARVGATDPWLTAEGGCPPRELSVALREQLSAAPSLAGLCKLPQAALDTLDRASPLMRELDKEYSVLTYMQIAACALETGLASLQRDGLELTADITIPALQYMLARARPKRLASTIAFVASFRLEALEHSALGYSFTTLEAAARQMQLEVAASPRQRHLA